MRRSLQLFSLVLLALWASATQHCAMEAAGIIPTTCQDEWGAAAGKSGASASDSCDVVEHAAYRISRDAVKAHAPDFAACACFLYLHFALYDLPVETVLIPVGTIDRPLDWVTTWQFTRRAALPSRAPSLLCA